MYASSKIELLNQAVTATATSDVKTLDGVGGSFVGFIKVSGYSAGTFTGIIEHSPNGLDWFTLITFTAAIAANSSEIKFPANDICLTHIRAKVTAAAAPDATVEISLCYSSKK